MYQCLGLATESEGGCDEDWWHPECLMGLPRDWYASADKKDEGQDNVFVDQPRTDSDAQNADQDHPVPPGFPSEEHFEALICYKCVQTSPCIKRYGHTDAFIALQHQNTGSGHKPPIKEASAPTSATGVIKSEHPSETIAPSKKRKIEEEERSDSGSSSPKRQKNEPVETKLQVSLELTSCRKEALPPALSGLISLVACDEEFRSHFCRCPECYPSLSKFPQLLEEEEIYEPPLSEDEDNVNGVGSVGTGSLLERGEAALSNVDRVRAIGKVHQGPSDESEHSALTIRTEGVMVYNHLKDKVKSFLQPFAESGQAVGAEDIKAYFEKLRGDAEAIRAAGGAAVAGRGGSEGGDNRREESGEFATP